MFEDLPLSGLRLITPKVHGDGRGFFFESYNASTWSKAGLNPTFVQDNHSLSRNVGTVRGLHFQTEPFAQDKLIRVLNGRILDIAVDVRRSSSTFGHHIAVELSKANWRQLFIPKGFAHGFMTLEPNTEVLYKVTDFYTPSHDHGIAWNDPDLGINWGIEANEAILSDKDSSLPRLREIKNTFP